MEQSEFELVRFQNQPAEGGRGVPDAEIRSSCRILVETKTEGNAVRVEQLQRHLKRFDDARESILVLLVVTPDQTQPTAIDQVSDPQGRLVWASFETLVQAIDDLLADPTEVVSEREAFLLRELQTMLAAEGLVGSADDVVVVAARHAWPEYNRCHAYICQPKRSFRPVKRVAFYYDSSIQPLIPLVLGVNEEMVFERGKHKGRFGEVVDQVLDDAARSKKESGGVYKVLLLSAPDDAKTMKLKRPIPNDLTSKTGRPTAFTMGQRYVSAECLQNATSTSKLI